MIYFDYSATTPVSPLVLDSFTKCSKEYFANPNSLHSLGIKSSELIKAATEQIASILEVSPKEIIYTSGASESNNTAIKGICYRYQTRGKHIITTEFEHSSIYGPISFLQKEGFDVDFVKILEDGKIDLENLKSLIRNDTILVSIASVNSEIGLRQDINTIGKIVKEKNPKCFFHVDMTQSIGKEKVSFENVDLASFSAHKFYGLKGVGVLVKKGKIEIEPLIHGGKSTTNYRSGTPFLPLIVSLSKALRLSYDDIESKNKNVSYLNSYLKENLMKYPLVKINSNENCIPHILNLSLIGVKPETLQHSLEEYDIYISTKTACSSSNSASRSVLALTKDSSRASSSVRISLSYLSTKEECDEFLRCFSICYKKLTALK